MANELEEIVKVSIDTAKKHPSVTTIGATTVAGAAIGSMVPVVGTAIGAGLGAIVGGVGVIAKEIKNRK